MTGDPVTADPRERPPLAERMRPQTIDELVGQGNLIGEGGVLRSLLESGRPPSLILWGPPGCGKTTVARIIARVLDRPPEQISAVTSGVKEVKEIVARARDHLTMGGAATLLFVDEIHRFNKAQQDAFLGPVEEGVLFLVGATTENPSFELNAALLSRCRVLVFQSLDDAALETLLDRALTDSENGLGETPLPLDDNARRLLVDRADGDARALLTDLEWIALGTSVADGESITPEDVAKILATRAPRYDKSGEEQRLRLFCLEIQEFGLSVCPSEGRGAFLDSSERRHHFGLEHGAHFFLEGTHRVTVEHFGLSVVLGGRQNSSEVLDGVIYSGVSVADLSGRVEGNELAL